MDKVIDCKVVMVERESKKTGNKYSALQVILPNGFQKLVFLDDAEKYIFSTVCE